MIFVLRFGMILDTIPPTPLPLIASPIANPRFSTTQLVQKREAGRVELPVKMPQLDAL
jgi:hypothetical protein